MSKTRSKSTASSKKTDAYVGYTPSRDYLLNEPGAEGGGDENTGFAFEDEKHQYSKTEAVAINSDTAKRLKEAQINARKEYVTTCCNMFGQELTKKPYSSTIRIMAPGPNVADEVLQDIKAVLISGFPKIEVGFAPANAQQIFIVFKNYQ